MSETSVFSIETLDRIKRDMQKSGLAKRSGPQVVILPPNAPPEAISAFKNRGVTVLMDEYNLSGLDLKPGVTFQKPRKITIMNRLISILKSRVKFRIDPRFEFWRCGTIIILALECTTSDTFGRRLPDTTIDLTILNCGFQIILVEESRP